MPENNNSGQVQKTFQLENLFDRTMVEAIYKEIQASRRCAGDDVFTYAPIEKTKGDKTYVITSRHMSVRECMTFSNSSCNKCWGTGRIIKEVEKHTIPNVEDFVMLSSISFAGLSEEQRKIVLEKEKSTKFWKLLLPCSCTIKRMLKKGKQIVSNDMRNIVIEITCTEKTQE